MFNVSQITEGLIEYVLSTFHKILRKKLIIQISLKIRAFSFRFLEKEMATHSSTLAWKIAWTGKPDRLKSIGSQTVGPD